MSVIYQTLRKPLWALVGLALLVGLWGLYERLAFGHESMAYGSYVVWGLWVAMYLFFAGISAGAFLVAVLNYLFDVKIFCGLGRLFLFASFLALIAGLLHIWFDVGHMGRVWRLFLTPSPSSVMVHMIWFYTAFTILVVVILAVDLWQGSRRLIKWLSALGIPVAIAFSGGVGALLGIQAARPFWHVGLFPVQFPVFSLASGVALVTLLVAVFVDETAPGQGQRNRHLLNVLGITTIVLTLVKLYFLWADFSQALYGGLPANVQAIEAVLFGPHWWAFWISGLQILWESASSKTLEDWAKVCDVKASDLVEIAEEFTSHGKKAAVDIHRGVSQHTNGFYNVYAWFSLAALIGNYDWKGGQVKGSTYDVSGKKAEGPFDLGKMKPGALSPFGISLIRHEVKYEDTTLFAGYPAKRNWYPLASDIYQEIVTSAGDAYPYPIKAAFLYMGSPVYSLPAGHTNIEILADVNKLSLFVTWDIVIGETSMYADYIFPDLSNLERWEFSGTHFSMTVKLQGVRQPTMGPLVETVKAFGQEIPISLESTLLALAETMGVPGFGPQGFAEDKSFTHMDDLYLKMVANLAFGEEADGSEAVPDADDEEVRLFLEARKHLPKSVFDPGCWKAIVGGELWRKVVYVLNRGGRFQDYAKIYDGDPGLPVLTHG
ncbi:hypothetical protein HKBW3S06_00783 [Candidatus Hakubella thermalkaliphila]|uniref:Uncharacterized protein n=1 Tax=Candidatus Hakubella thermalkaliphila TaxID=2754717 RepID=A0A6V8NSX6_9ACTN|nr:hypothetical protein HKBW3S06_00783 [Candidatus Hakubella thermalkaliphila]